MTHLLTALEVAARLGLMDHEAPTEAVRYLRRGGRLVGVQVGRRWRYREADVEAFIASCPRSRAV